MVKELPPRLSILLAFIVFQLISLTGIVLRLNMETILRNALYGIVFAGLLGFIIGLLLEQWSEKGLFYQRERPYEEDSIDDEDDEDDEEDREDTEDEKEGFKEVSFPEATSKENTIYRQK